MNAEYYIQRCLELAQLGFGAVAPNPMVGCVIVHNNLIIGEGWHQVYGGPHAEVNAINQVLEQHSNAAELLQQATLYVSLEPCAHTGKTPPCADLIITHKIPKVVIGITDPFAKVNGAGTQKLRNAGIEVHTDVLPEACKTANKRFFTFHQEKRPYIILKWAQTADKYIAPIPSQPLRISSTLSEQLVHQWRTQESAILVGKNTALIDNPQLTARLWQGKNPTRIVIDERLELPVTHHLFNNEVKTIVFNGVKTAIENTTTFVQLDFDEFLPHYILYQLYLQDIQSVLIEGGAATLNTFIQAGLWDEARIFTSQSVLKTGLATPILSGNLVSESTIDTDRLCIWLNNNFAQRINS